LRVHPQYLVDETSRELVELWHDFRGHELRVPLPVGGQVVAVSVGRSPGRLPCAGGLLDQPAYLLAAFAVMAAAEKKLQAALAGDAL
jgi:hypothetical protein